MEPDTHAHAAKSAVDHKQRHVPSRTATLVVPIARFSKEYKKLRPWIRTSRRICVSLACHLPDGWTFHLCGNNRQTAILQTLLSETCHCLASSACPTRIAVSPLREGPGSRIVPPPLAPTNKHYLCHRLLLPSAPNLSSCTSFDKRAQPDDQRLTSLSSVSYISVPMLSSLPTLRT